MTKDKLLQTATHYQKIIDGEKAGFAKAMAKQTMEKVAGKEKEVETLRATIEKHKEQIKQLEAQIAKYQKTIDGADEQVKAAKAKIDGAKEKFDFAHQSVMNQIDKDIENIQKYI